MLQRPLKGPMIRYEYVLSVKTDIEKAFASKGLGHAFRMSRSVRSPITKVPPLLPSPRRGLGNSNVLFSIGHRTLGGILEASSKGVAIADDAAPIPDNFSIFDRLLVFSKPEPLHDSPRGRPSNLFTNGRVEG